MVTEVFVGEVNGRHGDHKLAIPCEAQLEQAQVDKFMVVLSEVGKLLILLKEKDQVLSASLVKCHVSSLVDCHSNQEMLMPHARAWS